MLFGKKAKPQFSLDNRETRFFVRGMSCNHCKMNVETNLKKPDGTESVSVDLNTETVVLTGNFELKKVKETIESIGYKFEK